MYSVMSRGCRTQRNIGKLHGSHQLYRRFRKNFTSPKYLILYLGGAEVTPPPPQNSKLGRCGDLLSLTNKKVGSGSNIDRSTVRVDCGKKGCLLSCPVIILHYLDNCPLLDWIIAEFGQKWCQSRCCGCANPCHSIFAKLEEHRHELLVHNSLIKQRDVFA